MNEPSWAEKSLTKLKLESSNLSLSQAWQIINEPDQAWAHLDFHLQYCFNISFLFLMVTEIINKLKQYQITIPKRLHKKVSKAGKNSD